MTGPMFGGAGLPPGFRRATPQEAQAMMQRLEDEARARRTAAVAKHGPEARATARCWREDALYDVATLLTVRGGTGQAPSLMGWTGGPRSSLPPEVRREIGGAVRMPATVAATLAEHRHWQERAEVRAAFNPEAEPPLWIRARILLLEERLDTLPARDRDDVLARLDWMAAVLDLGYSRAIEEDEACLTTLRQDIEGGAAPLRERAPDPDEAGAPDEPPARPQASAEPPSGAAADPPAPKPVPPSERAPSSIDPGAAPAPVQVGQPPRTREEAREAVRVLLAENEGLTDREIARRVGVSPSTVAAVRKAVQHGGPPP